MDKTAFFKNIENAQKSRKISEAPKFTEEEITSSTAVQGGALESFERNFKKNHGDVFYDSAKLIEFLKSKACKFGVADAKREETFGLENEFELAREFDRKNKQDSYDFGISKASFAIGETGGIVLKDIDTADRMTTIAPWIHIAVIDANSIVPTLSDAFKKTFDTPYAIYVTGPSKTSDVEGVLVEGVHGPGVQIAFILQK